MFNYFENVKPSLKSIHFSSLVKGVRAFQTALET